MTRAVRANPLSRFELAERGAVDAKARRELSYTSRPYREGLADAIAWFRQAGYLR